MDLQGTHRLAARIASGNVVLFALMRFAQWSGWGGLEQWTSIGAAPGDVLRVAATVVVGNAVVGVLLVQAVFLLRPERFGWLGRLSLAVAAGAVGGGLRLFSLRTIPAGSSPVDMLVDWSTTTLAVVVAVCTALLVSDLVDRYRAQERLRSEHELQAARTVTRLESEEAVRRRLIADRLHGSVQNHLVMVTGGLDVVAERLRTEGHELAPVLGALVSDLDEVRERDVRTLSQDVFPAAADVSTTRAVRVLLDRLPPVIGGELVVGDAYREAVRAHGDPLPLSDRLPLVDAVEEGLTNALKHGGAQRVLVMLDLVVRGAGRSVVTGAVVSDGTAPPVDPVLSGLDRQRTRFEARGGLLRLEPGPGGAGARLSFEVPVPEPVVGDDVAT